MTYEPPKEISEAELADISAQVLARPNVPYVANDEVFRIDCAGLGWDIAGRVFEPDAAQALIGADGKKVGALLIHGGGGDHRGMNNLATLLVEKFGIKVVTVSYPGHFHWDSENHDWPGTPEDDGTGHPRLPLFDRQNPIGHDEYDLVVDKDEEEVRLHRGTSFFLAARPGTQFWHRMAAWPLAYETAFITACERNFPVGDYSLYLNGASTGGPFAHLLLQRMPNVVGLIGMETSAWGEIKKDTIDPGAGGERFPFNYLTLRTWRDRARYMGVEAGAWGARHLPLLMEQVFEAWERDKSKAGIKVEQYVQYAAIGALTDAANALADILGSDPDERASLVKRYISYTAPLSGPDQPPVPPLLYIINEHSRDHRLDNYNGVLFPYLEKLQPAPKARLVYFYGGAHNFNAPSAALPRGVAPVGASIWVDAITKGYYV
jgi:hypothetical protein